MVRRGLSWTSRQARSTMDAESTRTRTEPEHRGARGCDMNAEIGHTRPSSISTPPYAAFVAFEAFLQRAADEPVPPAVDKPLLVAWEIAAGNESALLTSLRSLGI